jgi:chemotaxis receptor (MCP) glutamine deamidase CheD
MAMIISRQPTPVHIMAVQKQLENMIYGSCFGSTITDDEKCTCKIKTTILKVRAAFKKMKTFHQQFDLHLTKKPVTSSIWSIDLGAETCTLRKVDQRKVLKYDVGEGWRRSVGLTMYSVKNEEMLHRA